MQPFVTPCSHRVARQRLKGYVCGLTRPRAALIGQPIVNLESCLPVELRLPLTTIARVAAGLSGAGVYRVDANGAAYALKISDDFETTERWRSKLHMQQMAAGAGLSPRIVHVDEDRRAVLTDFVVDQSFPAQLFNPATREAALRQIGQTLRRVHDLPLRGVDAWLDPRELLGEIGRGLAVGFSVPSFVGTAIAWGLTHEPPPPDREEVVSHNDVNPSNLLFDGHQLMLVDWEAAGRNDPYYDLAAATLFFRMDAETSRRLVEIHDGAPVGGLSERFRYVRRFVATLIGTMFMRMARANGHAGAPSATLASALSLTEFYQAMRAGTLNVASPDGQVAFGMALIRESTAYDPASSN
jgi:aminoglycoside phosphotransferase (APT) family kinase protein